MHFVSVLINRVDSFSANTFAIHVFLQQCEAISLMGYVKCGVILGISFIFMSKLIGDASGKTFFEV